MTRRVVKVEEIAEEQYIAFIADPFSRGGAEIAEEQSSESIFFTRTIPPENDPRKPAISV
jgi:hypothetical protein